MQEVRGSIPLASTIILSDNSLKIEQEKVESRAVRG